MKSTFAINLKDEILDDWKGRTGPSVKGDYALGILRFG